MPRPRSSRVIWNGNPGEVWRNDTGVVRYQLICNFANSCGVCIQYHLAISNWWPIPFHRSCRCRQLPIAIGGCAEAFEDFRTILDGLDHHAQVEAIGASNFRLLESGVVKWEDIVRQTRVLDLKEVVNEQRLSVAQMIKAGVRPDLAEKAYAEAHSPKAQVVRAARQQALKNLEASGISREQVAQHVTYAIGQRIGIAAGPSGLSTIKSLPGSGRIPKDLSIGLNRFQQGESLPVPFKRPISTEIAKLVEVQKPHANPAIATAQEICRKRGVPCLVLSTQTNAAAVLGKRSATIQAAYLPAKDTVVINATGEWWSNPERIREAHDRGLIVAENQDEMIAHEIGHYEHRGTVGLDEYRRLAKATVSADFDIAKLVSRYGATSESEFVAEVYTGLSRGVVYPVDVMDYYRKLKGPIP